MAVLVIPRPSSWIFRSEIMATGNTVFLVWRVRRVLWGWRPCGVNSHRWLFLSPVSHFFFRQDLFLCVLEVSQLSVVPADTTFARRQVSPIDSRLVRSRDCRLQQKKGRNLKNLSFKSWTFRIIHGRLSMIAANSRYIYVYVSCQRIRWFTVTHNSLSMRNLIICFRNNYH